MLELILLILLLLFFNQEIFNNRTNSQENFMQGYINPYFETEFNTSGPDNEYYYDRKWSQTNYVSNFTTIKRPPYIKKNNKKKKIILIALYIN